jgi:hypothetical protein
MWSPNEDAIDDSGQDTDAAVSDQRVLVAVMNNRRDFAIARDLGWYRIPFKRAPAQVGADYLAFYHTAAFEREVMWSVHHYAPVRGYRLVTRAQLLPDESDHPRAADRYYRIDIGPLLQLPHPIPSRRLRRITFISTTLARLLAASEINDLWEASDAAERLWAAFREAAVEAERRYTIGEGRTAYVADFAIPGEKGGIAILVDGQQCVEVPGWVVLHLSERQILDDAPSCLDLVQKAIRMHQVPRRERRD